MDFFRKTRNKVVEAEELSIQTRLDEIRAKAKQNDQGAPEEGFLVDGLPGVSGIDVVEFVPKPETRQQFIAAIILAGKNYDLVDVEKEDPLNRNELNPYQKAEPNDPWKKADKRLGRNS